MRTSCQYAAAVLSPECITRIIFNHNTFRKCAAFSNPSCCGIKPSSIMPLSKASPEVIRCIWASAIVYRQPGGSLCIIPVHAHHHGRIFLPFADDDPKTAVVISKVLLLARDNEIKDPSILEQIFAKG